MHVQFWLKVKIENAMTRLGSMCTGCCVKSIIYNAVTKGTHTHTHQSIHKNGVYKILWDFNIQTDKAIEHRHQGIVCINKQKRQNQIIHVAIPGGQNKAKLKKIDKYQDLRIELQKVLNVKVVIILVVTGAPDTTVNKK